MDLFQVVLLNGNWDTSNEIPNIIAEMHNVNVEELQSLQGTCSSSKQIKLETNDCPAPSPLGSDSGIEGDCSEGNLSWLLNYKIHELPPVPGTSLTNFARGPLKEPDPNTPPHLFANANTLPHLFNNIVDSFTCFVNNRLVI